MQGICQKVPPVLRVRRAHTKQWWMNHAGRAQITAFHYKALRRRPHAHVKRVTQGSRFTYFTGTKVQILTHRRYRNNAQSCVACVAGKYKRDKGNQACDPCPLNATRVTASSRPDACECKAGYYMHAGVAGDEECAACARGTYAPQVSSYCYICVLILLYMCPHTATFVSSGPSIKLPRLPC
jgi:hypothetical protein